MKLSNKLFFPALTGYRAIAAWMIFVYHFFPFKNEKYPIWIKQIVWEFHIGVDMFFVLSGFLITYRYFNDHPINFRKYMVNRFARIYPMYFLVTLLVFSVGFYKNGIWNLELTKQAVLSFTMTKALFSKYFLSGIPQGWTLTLEELFYITAPFYFILIRKNKYFLILLPVIILLFGIGVKHLFAVPQNTSGFLQKNIATYIFEFFAGIALAFIILKNKLKPLKIPILTFWGIGFIILYFLFRHSAAEIFNLRSDVGRAIEMLILAAIGIAPLLWGLIFEKSFVQKFLGSNTMVLLGKASYIFYLIHKGFLPIFLNDYIWDNKLFIFIALNMIAILMYKFMEEPANKWIRSKFAK